MEGSARNRTTTTERMDFVSVVICAERHVNKSILLCVEQLPASRWPWPLAKTYIVSWQSFENIKSVFHNLSDMCGRMRRDQWKSLFNIFTTCPRVNTIVEKGKFRIQIQTIDNRHIQCTASQSIHWTRRSKSKFHGLYMLGLCVPTQNEIQMKSNFWSKFLGNVCKSMSVDTRHINDNSVRFQHEID